MSATRSFSGTITAAALIYSHPVNLVSLSGTVAAAGYLMIFDSATAPVNGATPVAVLQATAAGPLPSFSTEVGTLTMANGLAICMSSTNGTLTIAATSLTYNGRVEEWGMNPADEPTIGQINPTGSVVGTTSIFWSEGDTANSKLLTVSARNVEAEDRYLMLFAYDGPDDGSVPISVWKVPASSTKNLDFGSAGGREVFSFAPGTWDPLNGCCFVWSTTAPLLTEVVSESHVISGTYRYTA